MAESRDAQAEHTPNALLASLNTPLGAGLHVVCAQGSNGARVEPLLTVINIVHIRSSAKMRLRAPLMLQGPTGSADETSSRTTVS